MTAFSMTKLPPTDISAQHQQDVAWVTRCRTGDARAFRELVAHYTPLVYRVLYRLLGQAGQLSALQNQAEDLTQEVFIKVFQHLNSYDTERPLKPWLLRIATNTAMSELRRTQTVVSLHEYEEAGHELNQEGRMGHDATAISDLQLFEDRDRVSRAMAKLSARYRGILLLRYVEDLPYEDIATTLNIPLNTVRTWLKRSREQLKQSIIDMENT